MSGDLTNYNKVVQWIYDEIVIRRKAPGLIVGLSGSDSIVTFLAAYRAFEKAGIPNRVMGVHFAPSEDFLYDRPEAEAHLWFSKEVVPWLRQQTPLANVLIDTSIDWRCDGLRWGRLMDLSVVMPSWGVMRLPDKRYWVSGTRNKTEDAILNYSNASTMVSVQPIINIWKSEILDMCVCLNVPSIVMNKSCETDCICGRMGLPARHPRELDAIIKQQRGEISPEDMPQIEPNLYNQLSAFIKAQIYQNWFKNEIPYRPV